MPLQLWFLVPPPIQLLPTEPIGSRPNVAIPFYSHKMQTPVMVVWFHLMKINTSVVIATTPSSLEFRSPTEHQEKPMEMSLKSACPIIFTYFHWDSGVLPLKFHRNPSKFHTNRWKSIEIPLKSIEIHRNSHQNPHLPISPSLGQATTLDHWLGSRPCAPMPRT